jgi:hypothetical protein
MPETAPEKGTAAAAAVSVMPGAFGKHTTLNMFRWVHEKATMAMSIFRNITPESFRKHSNRNRRSA